MDHSFLSAVSTICDQVLSEEEEKMERKINEKGNKGNGNICDNDSSLYNHNPYIQWSTKAKVAISYLANDKLERIIGDLEAFSRHAKRSTITVDDLKLVCRRNESISNILFNNISIEKDINNSIDSIDFNLSDIDDLDVDDVMIS